MAYNTTLEQKQISHRTKVNTFVLDMITILGEEPQKKAENTTAPFQKKEETKLPKTKNTNTNHHGRRKTYY
jgi:hypothetical protein